MTSTEPQHDIAVSRATQALEEEPDAQQITRWLESALAALQVPAKEVSVRIVDMAEITQLNDQYRSKPTPTNVLSFPSNIEFDGRELLGDIVICSQVVRDEAEKFTLGFQQRYAHMLVHGLLHLLGHDHEQDTERQQMEMLETELMAGLGLPDPYVIGQQA